LPEADRRGFRGDRGLGAIARRGAASGGRVEDLEVLEVAVVEAAVAREQAVGLVQGMGADEEVGDDAVATAAGPSVGSPAPTGAARRG
jgi:hypothetical protein